MKDARYWELIQAQEAAEEEARWKAKCEAEMQVQARAAKRIWTEDEIKRLVQENDKVLYGALLKLYGEQTSDEQDDGATKYYNKRGFNGADSRFLSSVAEFLKRRGFLTDKQKYAVRKRLVKYNKQLTRLANEAA